jgi:hypothetical protein
MSNLLILLRYPLLLLLLSDNLWRLLLELVLPTFVNETNSGFLIATTQSNGRVWQLIAGRFQGPIRFLIRLMDDISTRTTAVLVNLVRRWQLRLGAVT